MVGYDATFFQAIDNSSSIGSRRQLNAQHQKDSKTKNNTTSHPAP